jgi:hypothetical protein
MNEATEARPNGAFPPDRDGPSASWAWSRRGVTFPCIDHLCRFARMAGRRKTGPRPLFLSDWRRSWGVAGEEDLGERSGSQSGVARPGRARRRSADLLVGEHFSREGNPGDPVTAPQKESPGHKPTRDPRTPVPHHPRRSGIRCGALAREGELREPLGTCPAVALAPTWSPQWTTTTSTDGQMKEAAAVPPSILPLPSTTRSSQIALSPGSARPSPGTGVSRSAPATR